MKIMCANCGSPNLDTDAACYDCGKPPLVVEKAKPKAEPKPEVKLAEEKKWPTKKQSNS